MQITALAGTNIRIRGSTLIVWYQTSYYDYNVINVLY